MTIKNRAAEAVGLKEKNELFFKTHHPHIYKVIKNHDFEHLTLRIDSTTGFTDVFDGKQSIYNGDLDKTINEEIAAYKEQFSEGKAITTIAPPTKDSFPYHRYFSNRMRELVETSTGTADQSNTYQIPNFYPLIFFMGCWTGLHIQKFLSENRVLKCIIFEPNPEKFLLSLYITDWKEVFEHAKENKNEISITLGSDKHVDITSMSNNVWNMFVNQCPSFPLMSLFYNHLGDSLFTPIINRVRSDMHLYLNQWGYYDDEVNQLNNAFHNIAAKVPAFPQNREAKKQNIFIVGAGPSLDEKMDQIKKYRQQVIVVSCGSGLRPLVKNGITPDYHVELESHMMTFEVLDRPEYKNVYEKTVLIAALQLPPNVFNLFKNKYFFIKDSSALSALFTSDKSEIITGATPTCTNAGFALFSHLNYENIFLFGLDFGFIDKEKHHSENSIYFEKGNSENFNSETENTFDHLVQVLSVYDKPILSVPMYCTSRRSLENCITNRNKQKTIRVYNCSEGAKIEGTTHLPSDAIDSVINKNIKPELLDHNGNSLYNNTLSKKIEQTHEYLEEMCNEIISIISNYKGLTGLENEFRMSHQINRRLINNFHHKYGGIFYILRGTIWHTLHTGMSVALSIKDENLKDEYLRNWRNTFLEIMTEIPKHFNNISSKEYPDINDPWIQEDIAGNEVHFME